MNNLLYNIIKDKGKENKVMKKLNLEEIKKELVNEEMTFTELDVQDF